MIFAPLLVGIANVIRKTPDFTRTTVGRPGFLGAPTMMALDFGDCALVPTAFWAAILKKNNLPLPRPATNWANAVELKVRAFNARDPW